MTFLKFLHRMLREQKSTFVILIFLMTLVAVIEGLIVGLVVPLLDLVVEESVTPGGFLGKVATAVEEILDFLHMDVTLGAILGIIVLMFVIQGLVRLLQMHVQMTMQVNYQLSLIRSLFGGYLSSSWPFLLKSKIGQLVNVMTAEAGRATTALHYSCLFIASLLITGFYAVLAILISWKIALFALALCLVASLFLRKLMRQAEDYGFRTSRANNELQGYAYDKLAAAKMLKASVTGPRAVREMTDVARRATRLRYLSMMNQSAIRSLYEPLAIGILAVVAYLAFTYWRADIATLLIFVFLFFRLLPYFTQLQTSYQQALIFMPGLWEVDKLVKRMEMMPDIGGEKRFKGFDDAIVFDNVSFAYDGSSLVLNNVNLEIKKGESVAVVGESGAGKTTLVDLLLGLIAPTKGQVLIDGVPLNDYAIDSWRQRVGYMSQDIFLFHDTIEANVKWIVPDASEEKVRAAVKAAYADGFLGETSEGYNTVIGDRGARLSVGQRQRLALARIILQDPEIIVLDEATSSLDSESEAMIQQAMDEIWASKTIIVISHKLSTVRNVDRIYVLENGTIVEAGKWDELVARGGRFEQLRAMQDL